MIKKIRKGMKVKVIDDGHVYPGYERMAEKLQAKRWEKDDWGIAVNGAVGILRNSGKADGTIICLIDFKGKEVLVSVRGLKAIKGEFTQRNLLKI